MSDIQHFEGFSYVNANFRAEISFDRMSKAFQETQQWLGDSVLEDCKPRMPFLAGNLQQRSHTEDGGSKVVFPGPYGRFQHEGKVMVDPDTGSPWARQGVEKVLTDRPLKYSNPQATDHWFDAAKAQHGEYWVSEVKRRAGGG